MEERSAGVVAGQSSECIAADDLEVFTADSAEGSATGWQRTST